MYTYAIDIEGVNYVANLIVSDGKVVWEKDENGVIFRKRLDGKFSINRSGNEPLFDRILLFTFCEQGILSVQNNTELVIQGSFRKKHLTISEDKCRIDIKFDKIDEYTCLDKIADKEFNILANYDGKPAMPIYSAKHYQAPNIEYATGTGYVEDLNVYYNGYWMSDTNMLFPYPKTTFYPDGIPLQTSWVLYSNKYELVSAGSLPNTNNFNITTTWAREVKLIVRLGSIQTEVPTNTEIGCDYFGWQYSDSLIKNGLTYDKFTRRIPQDGFENILGGTPTYYDYPSFTMIDPITFDCGGIEYKFNRCRKLNDVITTMIYDCFPAGFKSEFFKSTVNPVSGRDLSNIMLSQKSDCIFELDGVNYVEKGDPATKGIITFKNLMEYLFNEFQVYWAIDENGDFRIEHKKYWDNNGSYDVANTVDIDLSLVYPTALNGSNEYTFENNIPIRETFSFMESWNIDFIGTPISYENCVDNGQEISHIVSEITTDIDPNFLFSVAAKEGFCMFHCNSVAEIDGSYKTLYDYGALSEYVLPNVHLSVANLQDSYWKYGRYLPYGEMNGKAINFDVRALKYQIPLSFPYCVSEFNPQKLIATNLGNGIVKSASFSFRSNFITVELEYIDSI